MSFLSGMGDLLKQFTGDNANQAVTGQQFSQVAESAPQSAVASGLAEVFRSGQTAPFAQLTSKLFSNSNGQQQATLLNTLMASAGPAMLAKLTGGSSSPLAGLLQGNQGQITPEQAGAVKPEEVQALAEHAEQQDPSIIDRLSQVYAAHPQLIQTLGTAAMTIAVQQIARHHNESQSS